MSSNSAPSFCGALTLGHIFTASGVDTAEVMVLRHTYTKNGLESAADLTPSKTLAYTQEQGRGPMHKLGKHPPRLWVVFIADGARRSRLLTSYENRGEIAEQQTDSRRYFDLRPSDLLSNLTGRLVVEWSGDAVNWAKRGLTAAKFPVLEIADPEVVPFPGFDQVLLDYGQLRDMIDDSRYAAWHTALGSVQGVYLIADNSSGQLYVGKADGEERILGRWSQYAHDGHGSNKALRELAGIDPSHARHFQFSILRVFGPSVPTAEIDRAEAHYKRALLTRDYGLNRN